MTKWIISVHANVHGKVMGRNGEHRRLVVADARPFDDTNLLLQGVLSWNLVVFVVLVVLVVFVVFVHICASFYKQCGSYLFFLDVVNALGHRCVWLARLLS